MTDETSVFVTLRSQELAICDWGSDTVELMLRCYENTTSVLINTECHVTSGFDDYGIVTYRIDDTAPRKRAFEASTDNKSLGLWGYRQSRPFIDDIVDGDGLIIRFSPYGENPVEVSFDISGAREAISPLREACGW